MITVSEAGSEGWGKVSENCQQERREERPPAGRPADQTHCRERKWRERNSIKKSLKYKS